MWGSFQSFAEKAKQAAASLEGQLDASVGVKPSLATPAVSNTPSVAEDDPWADDFDDAELGGDTQGEPEKEQELDEEKLEASSYTAAAVSAVRAEGEETPTQTKWDGVCDTCQFDDIDVGESEQLAINDEKVSEQQSIDTAYDTAGDCKEGTITDLAKHQGIVHPFVKPEQAQASEATAAKEAAMPSPGTSILPQGAQSPVPPDPTKKFNEETRPTSPFPARTPKPPTDERYSLQREFASIVSSETLDNAISKAAFASSLTAEAEVTFTTPVALSSDSEGTYAHAANAVTERLRQLEEQINDLQHQLHLREDQLMSKTEQLSAIQQDFEEERTELHDKLQTTKDEAKKRIQRAKERVEALELRLRQQQSDDITAQNTELIVALRAEGERLALKQSEMEKAVRTAKNEARELRDSLTSETDAKEKALERNSKLEVDVKSLKDRLQAARKGESQAEKLETEVHSFKEEIELKGAIILSLQQQIKELKIESKELRTELESARKGAASDAEREQRRLRKEHQDAIADMEQKISTLEIDSALREDALRHEVEELRKRWQDAVRRADSLSMDVNSSTAPLLRQLESTEKQSRARAAAWAELENKLRTELEETVIENEQLTKERTELRTKSSRLERAQKELEHDLKSSKNNAEESAGKMAKLEAKLAAIEASETKLKEKYAEVERLANDGISRVRSEMAQTMMDNEERHRAHRALLETKLKKELENRLVLETQVRELLDKATSVTPTLMDSSDRRPPQNEPLKVLLRSEDQAAILSDALGTDVSREGGDDDDNFQTNVNGHGSFAAVEHLNSRLKAAKVEVKSMKKSLEEAEQTRDRLTAELNESRVAKEKLPLFETKVKELTEENQELSIEVQGLREDIFEVKQLYRSQLAMLLSDRIADGRDTDGDDGV